MNKRQIDKFYNNYPPYFKDYAREKIKKVGKCEKCGHDGSKNRLTLAHLDQNPNNMKEENLRVWCTSCHIQFDQPYHIFSMSTNKKTDNSYIQEKVELRLESLKLINKKSLKILEAFAGDGVIWRKVQEQTKKKLEILKVDLKDGKKGVYLKGDNMKFIPLFDFSQYDIIDLDAYGSPYNQLNVVFLKNFKGIVHCTFIQSVRGELHRKMLMEIGYNENMLKKIPCLFFKDGLEKMKEYLTTKGVTKITGYFLEKKNYFYFHLGN